MKKEFEKIIENAAKVIPLTMAFIVVIGTIFYLLNQQVLEMEKRHKEVMKVYENYNLKLAEVETIAPLKPKLYNIPLSEELQGFTIETAKKYELDPKLIFAIMQTESEFNSKAENKGCYGLMQISKSNIKDYFYIADGNTDKGNIELGCYLLREYLNYYKSEPKALIRYNNTKNTANRLFNRGITSTSYTTKVYGNYDNLKELER